MSTRERAYNILSRFSDEELERFVAYFGIIYPDTDIDASENNSSFRPVSLPSDDVKERKAAFERMKKACRRIPDLNEKKSLAEHREEKYGK